MIKEALKLNTKILYCYTSQSNSKARGSIIVAEPTTPMTANHIFLNFLRAKIMGWKDADTYDLMIDYDFTIPYGDLYSKDTHILPGHPMNLWKHQQYYTNPDLTHFFLTIKWHEIHTLLGTLLKW